MLAKPTGTVYHMKVVDAAVREARMDTTGTPDFTEDNQGNEDGTGIGHEFTRILSRARPSGGEPFGVLRFDDRPYEYITNKLSPLWRGNGGGFRIHSRNNLGISVLRIFISAPVVQLRGRQDNCIAQRRHACGAAMRTVWSDHGISRRSTV